MGLNDWEAFKAVQAWAKEPQHTPDPWAIEGKNFNLLFVYDNMMRGRKQHELLAHDAVCLNDLFILKWGIQTVRTFSPWVHRDSGIGIAFRHPYPGVPLHRIRGELYAVRPSLLLSLDNIRVNGVQFSRQAIKIVISYILPEDADSDVSRGHTRDVWMYVGREAYWESQLSDYDFRRFSFARNNLQNPRGFGNYYHY